MDVRGASMIFSLARFSPGGSMEWSRAYAASANDNNNIHVVREADGVVYAGGRIGLDWYDAQMGDGMILALNANTGNETWSGFYFNGTGPADISEHRIKGMALAGSQMHLLTQVYTGTGNGERYWGYWYDGTGETADLTVDTSEVSCSVTAASDGEAFDAAPYRNGWTDAPASVVWQDADAKSDGYPPDADVMWMKVGM
jgi:hypothetical protein